MPELTVKDFNLVHTLECGQIFRVRKIDDWYYINTRNILFKVRQKNIGAYCNTSKLEFHGVDKNFIVHFFSLDEPLKKILAEINKDEHINTAISQYHGLRLVRQDPWECLISFLCSPASNIGKIKSTLEKLSEYFGKTLTLDGVQSNAFPEPGRINNPAKVKKSGAGFRTRFLIEANKNGLVWTNSFARELKTLPYSQAKKELKKTLGIGDKVADCVLLFSLGFTEAFPVDVWIKKVIQELYFNNQTVPNRIIGDFARDYFGKYAGYAQEYLYYYRRTLKT